MEKLSREKVKLFCLTAFSSHVDAKLSEQKVDDKVKSLLINNNADAFEKAFFFIEENLGQFFNFAFIMSEDEKTAKEAAVDREKLCQLMFNCLDIDVKKKQFNFNKRKAVSISQDFTKAKAFEYAKHPDLRALHGDVRNLGLQAKCKEGILTNKEWLTDLDLYQLIPVCGIGHTKIVSLDPIQIGFALHQARADNKNNKDYQVPFLVNLESMSDGKSQGTHWVNMVIDVKGGPPLQVNVDYTDSMSISEDQKRKVQQVLEQAFQYEEITNDRVFRAFDKKPDNVNVKFDSQEIQKDSWSCGYRALQNLLKKCGPTARLNPFTHVSKSIIDCEDTESLQRSIYSLSLAHILNKKKINKDDYLNYLEHKPTEAVPIDQKNQSTPPLDRIELKEQIALDKERRAQFKQIAQEIKIESEEKVQINIDVLENDLIPVDLELKLPETKAEIDVTEFFKNCKDAKSITSRTDALFDLLQQSTVTHLHLKNLNEAKDVTSLLAKGIEKLHNLRAVNAPSNDVDFNLSVQQTLGRNKLIELAHLKIDPKEDVWQQFWQARISNPSLFTPSGMGKFYLYSDGPPFDGITTSLGKKYFEELLNYCKDHESQLQDERFNSRELNLILKPEKFVNDEINQLYKRKGELSKLNTRNEAEWNRIHNEIYTLKHDESKQNDPASIKLLAELKLQIAPLDELKEESAKIDAALRKAGNNPEFIKLATKLNYDNLNSLTQHLTNKHGFPFEQIKLTVDLNDNTFELIKKLLIATKSYSNLTKIQLSLNNHVNFSEAQLIELHNLYSEHKLCVNFIELPGKNDPTYRICQQLHNTIATNIRNQKKPLQISDLIPKKVVKLSEPRACKRNRKTNINIDVEMQAEQQAEQQSEIQQEIETEPKGPTFDEQNENLIPNAPNDQDDFQNIISMQTFIEDASQNDIRNGFGSSPYPDLSLIQDHKELRKIFWEVVVGQSNLANNIKYLTKETLSQLKNSSFRLLNGLNIDNLPPGFFLQSYIHSSDPTKNGFMLCYDPTRIIPNKNASALTLKLSKRREGVERWLGDAKQFNIDETDKDFSKIMSPSEYRGRRPEEDKTPIEIYQYFIKLSNGLNPEITKQIIQDHEWCFSQDIHNPISMLCSPQNKLLISLIDLLHTGGSESVYCFLSNLKMLYESDSELFNHFRKHFMLGSSSAVSFYPELASPQSLKNIQTLCKMTPVQKDWWKKLVETEALKKGKVEFDVLFEGFKHFLDKVPKGIDLPPTCPISDSGNALVALDRLLFILGKVKARNIPDQFNALQDLDYSAEGAWYAARWDGFHFFHKEMQLNPRSLTNDAYIDLERVILNRKKSSYQINYDDLVKVASSDFTNMDIAKMLFHRFLGCSEKISFKYAKYIQFINQLDNSPLKPSIKIKILPILAFATTGENADKEFNIANLLAYAESANDKVRLEIDLLKIANALKEFKVKPDLNQATGLILLINQTRDTNTQNALFEFFKNDASSTLQSLNKFSFNKNPLLPEEFLHLATEFKKLDEGNIAPLCKLLACITKPHDEKEAQQLVEKLNTHKGKPYYAKLLKQISQIETKADHHSLSLKDLNNALDSIRVDTSPEEVTHLIKAALPNCQFSQQTEEELSSGTKLDKSAIKALLLLNEKLENAGLKKWDINLDNNIDPNQIKAAYDYNCEEIKRKGLTAQALFEAAKPMIKTFISDMLLKEIKDIQKQCNSLNAENFTRFNFLTPPKILSYDDIGKAIEDIQKYKNLALPIYELLFSLHKQWPTEINFSVINDTTNQFSPAQLNEVLDCIQKLGSPHCPKNLISILFGNQKLTTAEIKEFLPTIHIILELKEEELNINQKTNLIDLLVNKKANEDTIKLFIENILNFRKQNPALSHIAFNLLYNQLVKPIEANMDALQVEPTLLLKQTKNLLDSGTPEPVLTILLKKLEKTPQYYVKLLNTLDKIPKPFQSKFLKIISYGCLERHFPEKQNEIFSDAGLLKQLENWTISPVDSDKILFTEFSSLFEEKPCPQLDEILKRANDKQSIPEFVKNYNTDPFGVRKNPIIIDQQFDASTVHDHIERIYDLGRNQEGKSVPLLLAERNTLQDNMVYLDAVGRTYPLSLASTKKPAMVLTKSELKNCIAEYRKILSDANITQEKRRIAQLEFAAIAREAMYRTTGKFPYSTQMLSLVNAMLHGGNITSEIRTGEGKSLISALFAASKWMEGGAVDVCTSDMMLAGVNLEENTAFYEYLGIKTNIITATSTTNDYQYDGINYSDAAQLALFQQKMELSGERLPEKVSCVLDEVDFTILDNNTQFRYAVPLVSGPDPTKNPYEWVYAPLLDFVNEKNFMDIPTPEEDIKLAKQYVRQRISEQYRIACDKIPDEMWDKWIDAAYTATTLVENENYVIRNKVTADGTKCEARVKINNREAPGSKFSDGVHQFLHTRLQNEKDKQGNRKYPFDFVIEPEKTYLASKSSKNFVDYYIRGSANGPRGNVLGLTGTVGSIKERLEMRVKYNMQLYEIPPHRPLKRGKPEAVIAKPQLAYQFFHKKVNLLFPETIPVETPKQAKLRQILTSIRHQVAHKKPVLIICDSVESSKELYDYLKQSNLPKELLQLFNGEPPDKNSTQEELKRFFGDDAPNDLNQLTPEQMKLWEKRVVENAGFNGMVTISTGMFGRGTDFKPKNKEEGLHVISTYISDERSFYQEIGRCGRNGEPGTCELILSEDDFIKHGKSLPQDKDIEHTLQQIRVKIALEKSTERAEKQAFADIKNQFTDQYHTLCRALKISINNKMKDIKKDLRLLNKELKASMDPRWESFLKTIDKEWKKRLDKLNSKKSALSQEEYLNILILEMTEITKFAQNQWEKTYTDLLERIKNGLPENTQSEIGKDLPAIKQIQAFLPDFPDALDKVKTKEDEPQSPNASILKPAADQSNVYLELSQNKDVYPLAIEDQLDRYYQILFKSHPTLNEIKKLHSEFFNQALNTNDLKAPETQEALLKIVLHKTLMVKAESHFNQIQPNPTLDKPYKNLLNIITDFGTDKLKQIVKDMHATHFNQIQTKYTSHPNLGQYLQDNLTKFKEGIKEDKFDQSKLIKNHESWETIYQYATTRLNEYKKGWFIAKDRARATEQLQNRINSIHENNNINDEDKISAILSIVNEFSLLAIKSDLDEDKSRNTWFFYRNNNNSSPSGSRYQNSLKQIYLLAASHLDRNNPIHLTNQANYFLNLLYIMQERTQLEAYLNEPTIINFKDNHLLNDLITSLHAEKSDAKKAQSRIEEIIAQLSVLRETLPNNTAAQRAFKNYIDFILSPYLFHTPNQAMLDNKPKQVDLPIVKNGIFSVISNDQPANAEIFIQDHKVPVKLEDKDNLVEQKLIEHKNQKFYVEYHAAPHLRNYAKVQNAKLDISEVILQAIIDHNYKKYFPNHDESTLKNALQDFIMDKPDFTIKNLSDFINQIGDRNQFSYYFGTGPKQIALDIMSYYKERTEVHYDRYIFPEINFIISAHELIKAMPPGQSFSLKGTPDPHLVLAVQLVCGAMGINCNKEFDEQELNTFKKYCKSHSLEIEARNNNLRPGAKAA